MQSIAEYKEILSKFKKEFGPRFGIKELGILALWPEENRRKKAIWMCLFRLKRLNRSFFLTLKNC